MDRVISYVGAIPLIEQFMKAQQDFAVGLGAFTNEVMGASAVVADGMSCTPAGGLIVSIAPGSLTCNGTLPIDDASPFGGLPQPTLPAASQFFMSTAATLNLPAGQTTIIYGQAQYQDTGGTVLPYYNAANPLQPFNGPSGSGTSQPTARQNLLTVSAGTVSNMTNFPLWQVAVPSGATQITAAMIAPAPNSCFLKFKLPQLQPVFTVGGGALFFQFCGFVVQVFTGPQLSPGSTPNTQQTTNGTFPQAFPNACAGLWALDGGTGLLNWNTALNISASGFTIGVWSPIASTQQGQARLLAIGY